VKKVNKNCETPFFPQKKRERREKRIFEEIMDEIFLNLMKEKLMNPREEFKETH
jgi:hypothetical protein